MTSDTSVSASKEVRQEIQSSLDAELKFQMRLYQSQIEKKSVKILTKEAKTVKTKKKTE